MLTVGHSNRSLEDLVALLRQAGVTRVVDIRSHPASRRHPQFNRETLAEALAGAGVGYAWQGRALGGKRRGHPGDPLRHPDLEGAGLRAYARHMEGERFRSAVDRLLAADDGGTALMCAEADPRRCHRHLVADYLEGVRDHPVHHIMDGGTLGRHTLNPAARVEEGILLYAGLSGQMPLF